MLSFSLSAQNFDIEQCGLDSSFTLNADEAAYFNEILNDQRQDFDFIGKKVAFASGNNGHIPSNKFQYFAQDGRPRYESGASVVNQLIILTDREKAQFPELDAIIISWSKVKVDGRKREKLLSLLSE